EQMTRPSDTNPQYGLLMELFYRSYDFVASRSALDVLRAAGFKSADKLEPLVGRGLASSAAYLLEAGAVLDEKERADLAARVAAGLQPWETRGKELVAFGHTGSYGQFLVCWPKEHVVAVRQLKEGSNENLALVTELSRAMR